MSAVMEAHQIMDSRFENTESVLWLDDHIDNFSQISKNLVALGLEMRPKKYSPHEIGHDYIKCYKRLILDSKFKSTDLLEGASAAEALIDQVEDCRVIVFSAFIDREKQRVRTQSNPQTRSVILYVPKVTTEVEDTAEYFISLAKYFYEFFTISFDKIEDLKHPEVETKNSVAVIGFHDFENLRIGEKSKIYKAFRRNVQDRIDLLFAQGALWIFYAGSGEEPYKVAYTVDEILSTDEVSAVCARIDATPYVFRKDVRVDSTGCNNNSRVTGTPGSIEYYPFAQVIFATKEGTRTTLLPIHFDTGSDYTFLCSDFVEGQSVLCHNTQTFGELSIHGTPYLTEKIELDVIVVNSDKGKYSGMQNGVTLQALVVDQWKSTALMVHCDEACTNVLENGGMCKLRVHGLLGRTLYAAQGLEVLINGQSSQVDLIAADD